jgi:hypothetical protein
LAALIVPQTKASAIRRVSVFGLLKFEGLALFLIAVCLYARGGYSWQEFALLFLAPYLSLAFYLAGRRAGALFYNVAHSTILPIAIAGISTVVGRPEGLRIALIWLAHIGLDRALGYGLKRTSGFGDTHLGKIGKTRVASGE